jgi:RND superfamily putative drug exporter
LARLGRLAFKRRVTTLLTWLAILAAAVVAGLSAQASPADDFSMPGTESQASLELLQKRLPGLIGDGGEARVVFVAPEGEQVTSPRFKAAIESAVGQLADGKQVSEVADPRSVCRSSPAPDQLQPWYGDGADVPLKTLR